MNPSTWTTRLVLHCKLKAPQVLTLVVRSKEIDTFVVCVNSLSFPRLPYNQVLCCVVMSDCIRENLFDQKGVLFLPYKASMRCFW